MCTYLWDTTLGLLQKAQVETKALLCGYWWMIDLRSATCFCAYNTRKKDGKEHRYCSVVENRRLRFERTTQRTALYLGEISDTQQSASRKSLEVFNEIDQITEQICLFPEDRDIPPDVLNELKVNLSELTFERQRVFGDCWLGAGCGMNCNWRSSGGSTCPAAKSKSRGIKCWSY